jgi:hypothetical protein
MWHLSGLNEVVYLLPSRIICRMLHEQQLFMILNVSPALHRIPLCCSASNC